MNTWAERGILNQPVQGVAHVFWYEDHDPVHNILHYQRFPRPNLATMAGITSRTPAPTSCSPTPPPQ
jgi:hypothetical protein